MWRGTGNLEQPRPGMILEQIRVAHVPAKLDREGQNRRWAMDATSWVAIMEAHGRGLKLIIIEDGHLWGGSELKFERHDVARVQR